MVEVKRTKNNAKTNLEKLKFVPITYGEKAADMLSRWAGSWTFILTFLGFLILWMIVNFWAYNQHWDPYPFILLNLVLSCLAALQAPIILMSQNRQAKKDRLKSDYDYLVNRKSERKIEEVQRQLTRIERKIFGDDVKITLRKKNK